VNAPHLALNLAVEQPLERAQLRLKLFDLGLKIDELRGARLPLASLAR
jgi:hypothetical protein